MIQVSATHRRARVVVTVLAGVLLLAACGSTGAAGEGTSTVVATSSTTLPPTTADVAIVVDRHKPGLKKASNAFAKCDRKETADSYVAYRCLKQLRALTDVAEDLSAELGALQLPTTYVTIAANVRKLAGAGAAAEKKCAKAADQKCDQALAKFRADAQSVVWDLEL